MAVNVTKTNYIIFRTRGKVIADDIPDVVFNSNDPDSPAQCPMSIHKLDRIYDTNPDSKLKSYKLLGVHLDEYLSFSKHVQLTCSKLARANFSLRRVSNFVSTSTLKTLYYSMFHPPSPILFHNY